MATGSWIPLDDAVFDAFTNNFKTLIAANPTNYSLSTSDATTITTAYNNWRTAFLATSSPATKNKTTVITKNEMKTILLGTVRAYGATIRVNHSVSDALKTGLGIHIPDGTVTPVPPPSTAPTLKLGNMRPGLQEIVAQDETTGALRARPVGSAGMLLFRTVATTPAADPEGAQFLAFSGKTKLQVNYTSTDNGKTATYFARWTNAKGEMGPWSQPFPVAIAA